MAALAAFLKGAALQEGVRFTVICPSWSRESLTELFQAEGVPNDGCNVLSPQGVPVVLRLYEAWLKRAARPRKRSVIRRLGAWFQHQRRMVVQAISDRLVRAHSVASLLRTLLPLGLLTALALLLLSPIWLTLAVYLLLAAIGRRLRTTKASRLIRAQIRRIRAVLRVPKEHSIVLRLYRTMERAEALRMQSLIRSLPNVRAWYCPTAFRPAFNQIKAPRLMCVPDVVLADFPVGFANVGGDRFLESFQLVDQAITGGEHFVTYSAEVKWATLVDRYSVEASQVAVVHHAPNDLSKWISVTGFSDNAVATRHYCRSLLASAFGRSHNRAYAAGFANTNVRFLFYASQMRPNKNVLTLLRAYKYLLRERLIGHKLILTGNVSVLPEIEQFLREHNLEHEVLFLHGLKVQELAACYKLADLAVNPSLSEGGCPSPSRNLYQLIRQLSWRESL